DSIVQARPPASSAPATAATSTTRWPPRFRRRPPWGATGCAPLAFSAVDTPSAATGCAGVRGAEGGAAATGCAGVRGAEGGGAATGCAGETGARAEGALAGPAQSAGPASGDCTAVTPGSGGPSF